MHKSLIEYTSDLVVKVDPEGRFLFVSPSYCDLFGKSESELLGRKFMPLIHENDRKGTELAMRDLYRPPHKAYMEQRAMTRQGWRWLAWTDNAILNDARQVAEIVGVGRDITERKLAEAALRRSEQRFRAVATATNDLIYEWRIDSNELVWFGDIDKVLGYPPSGFPRTLDAWIEAIHPDDRETLHREVERMQMHGGTVDVSYRIATADGSWLIWEDKGTAIQEDGRVVSMIGGCTDVTLQRRAEKRLQHLAFHDALTELPNRQFLKELLPRLFETYRRDEVLFALHYLDLDHFKDVNDSLGHQFGDELLCQVAHRIKSVVRSADVFARLGGDEFAVVQTGVSDLSQVSLFAAKLVEAIGHEFPLEDTTVRTTTSIGIALPDSRTIDADDLLKKADTALYKAKDAGRGTYAFFDDSMTIALQREMELVSDLSSAVSAGQLCLEYQPQIDLASRQLIGVEALLRWNHPTRGRLLPGDFLGVAERRGLIGEISDWALGEACRQARLWCSEGRDFGRLAVNLSAAQVESEDFYRRICRHIEETGLDPRLLELEFTETVLMTVNEAMIESIRGLSDRGIQFAIDDFGTGFSSLSYLKNFHADKIKIDREFIRDLEDDSSDAEIVKATIALGEALGLETLAEGVENAAQAEFLVKNGCAQAQGYFFGRPSPPEEITAMLGATDQPG